MTTLSRQLFIISNSSFVADEFALETALHQAAAPDLQLSSNKDEIGFIRRKLPNADIYFVANTSNHLVSARATFATKHKFGEQWSPDTGRPYPGSVTAANLPIGLAPYESAVFVFSDTPANEPAPQRPSTEMVDLSTDWYVVFPSIRKSATERTLSDWTADPATRFYSGVAVYQRDFMLKEPPAGSAYLEVTGGTPLAAPRLAAPADPTARLPGSPLPNPLITGTGPGMRAWYDPPIREAAVVFINGHRAGALWHPPYKLEVGAWLTPGRNHVEIRVYNTALNAWAALPPRDYKPLIAKYGDRFQMQDLNKVQPVPSGLLGGIHLIADGAP